MIPYLFEQLGVGMAHAYKLYNHTILGFGRREWSLVLIAFALFGCLCMRGLGRRP